MHLSLQMWRTLIVDALVFSLGLIPWWFGDTLRHLWSRGSFNYCLSLCTQSPLVFCRIVGLTGLWTQTLAFLFRGHQAWECLRSQNRRLRCSHKTPKPRIYRTVIGENPWSIYTVLEARKQAQYALTRRNKWSLNGGSTALERKRKGNRRPSSFLQKRMVPGGPSWKRPCLLSKRQTVSLTPLMCTQGKSSRDWILKIATEC